MNELVRYKNIKSTFTVILFLVLSGCASKGIPTSEVYRIHGLKIPIGPTANDGIYQDFTLHNENVGTIWLDPDAEFRGSKARAAVQPWMVREKSAEPFLRIQFSRHGHGTNLMIIPKNKMPEVIPPNSRLKFSMRSQQNACVGIRIKEKDGEIWLFGQAKLEYQRICTKAQGEWADVDIPLTTGDWTRFPHNGNIAFGNNAREFDALTAVALELGLKGTSYLATGTAQLDIKALTVTSNH